MNKNKIILVNINKEKSINKINKFKINNLKAKIQIKMILIKIMEKPKKI